MDLNVRAMRLHTTIEALPDLACDVRVSQRTVATYAAHPAWLPMQLIDGDLTMLVVTITLWGKGPHGTVREVTFEERHKAHELVAKEFWEEIAQDRILSIQMV